jgi:SAM-dependent methyltransferase
MLENKGYTELYGVEIDPQRVRQARGRLSEASVVETDIVSFLIDEKLEFGLILMHAVIEHLEDDYVVELLSAVRSSLRPGGTFIVMTGNLANPFTNSIMFGDFDHKFGYTPSGLDTLLRDHNFQISSIQGFEHANYNGIIRYYAGWVVEQVPKALLRLGYASLRLRQPETLSPLMYVAATPDTESQ